MPSDGKPTLDYASPPTASPRRPVSDRITRIGVWLSTPRPVIVYYAVTFILSIVAIILIVLVRLVVDALH
jgi:hypothetical protein